MKTVNHKFEFLLCILRALESLWLKLVQSKLSNYAKQTQFAGSSNERKLCFNKGLQKNDAFAVPKNKPKTNPIPRKARMDVSLAITRNYNNEQRTMNYELLFKTNPIKPNLVRRLVRRSSCPA